MRQARRRGPRWVGAALAAAALCGCATHGPRGPGAAPVRPAPPPGAAAAPSSASPAPYRACRTRHCVGGDPRRRQYFDERRSRYYFFDPARKRYYWEDGSPMGAGRSP